MNIVVEGADASGKSTLCNHLSGFFSRRVVRSAGPPKNIEARVREQLDLDDVIFDRHACVSQTIYGMLRNDPPIDPAFIRQFYEQKPIIIFCQPPKHSLNGHVAKSHDTPEHLSAIRENAQRIQDAYIRWAVEKAHLFFRWSDDADRICAFVEGAFNEEL